MLKGRNILLGITGGIAAYKVASLIRMLVKEGADVKVVMTPLAKEFITPLTIATLSKNPILVDFYNPENGDWNSHVDLGLWADLYLIAPATANSMAKMAHGVADNLLLTSYLSARCPVMLAPAMDLDMFQHPATQKNMDILSGYGNIIVEAQSGELASGLTGKGRMEEPEKIFEAVVQFFKTQNDLEGKRVLVTSGPTYEPIDPVRFIGNHSSGLMGASVAHSLAQRGAHVLFVSGPSAHIPGHKNIEVFKVNTAEQMYHRAVELFPQCDAGVMAAAVADYTVASVANQKIKREGETLTIELEPTQDIAKQLGQNKRHDQILIGFALETENVLENAKRKLESKNLDFIVLNSPNDEGAGFNVPTNKITLIRKDGTVSPFPLKSKAQVAEDIVNELVLLYR